MSQNSRNQGFSYYICLMIEAEQDPDPDPDPYIWLMDPDSDPGGPKTRGSGSGSGTLLERKNQLYIHRPRVCTLAWTGKAAASRRAAWDLPLPSHPVNTSTAYPPAAGGQIQQTHTFNQGCRWFNEDPDSAFFRIRNWIRFRIQFRIQGFYYQKLIKSATGKHFLFFLFG